MVPESGIIDCHKIDEISGEIMNISEKTMKTRRVELTAGGKSLTEAKIQRGMFQGKALSPLLFIITMILLNPVLGKCKTRYRLSKSHEKINDLIYMDGIKLCQKWKIIGNSNTHGRNIQSGHRNEIWHRKIHRAE